MGMGGMGMGGTPGMGGMGMGGTPGMGGGAPGMGDTPPGMGGTPPGMGGTPPGMGIMAASLPGNNFIATSTTIYGYDTKSVAPISSTTEKGHAASTTPN
jgi:hypothetical protein